MGEFDGRKDEVARSKKHHPSAVRFPLGLNQANSTTEFALLSRARHNHIPDSYFLWLKKKGKIMLLDEVRDFTIKKSKILPWPGGMKRFPQAQRWASFIFCWQGCFKDHFSWRQGSTELCQRQLGAGTNCSGLKPELLVTILYLVKPRGRPALTKNASPPPLGWTPPVRTDTADGSLGFKRAWQGIMRRMQRHTLSWLALAKPILFCRIIIKNNARCGINKSS